MITKTEDLINDALDWAVAKAGGMTFAPVQGRGAVKFECGIWGPSKQGGGWVPYVLRGDYKRWFNKCDCEHPLTQGTYIWSPSTLWYLGGPIIEQSGIDLEFYSVDEWGARNRHESTLNEYGPTPLVAAMRYFVASKLGYAVVVPKELE